VKLELVQGDITAQRVGHALLVLYSAELLGTAQRVAGT